MRLCVLVSVVVLCGCTSNPCKSILSPDDVSAIVPRNMWKDTSSTEFSCRLTLRELTSTHGFDVQLELSKHPHYVAQNFESQMEELQSAREIAPLPGFGEHAVIAHVDTEAVAPTEDPKAVADQLMQRAIIDRSNKQLNQLAREAGVDAGEFNELPAALKSKPRSIGDYLARLPPRQHQVTFYQGDWVGSLMVDKEVMTPAEFDQLVKRIAPAVAKIE